MYRDVSAHLLRGFAVEIVMGTHVLEHIPDLCEFMSGVHTAMRAGGVVFSETPAQPPLRSLQRSRGWKGGFFCTSPTGAAKPCGGLHFFDSLALGPILGKILEDGGKFLAFLKKHHVHRNTRKTQKSHRMVRTCGLHVAVRIFCWQMTNPQYEKWLFSATNCMNPDQLVALMTIVGHL